MERMVLKALIMVQEKHISDLLGKVFFKERVQARQLLAFPQRISRPHQSKI